MLSAILSWLIKSQGVKTAGAAASGSVLSFAVLLGALELRVDDKIKDEKQQIIRYVDTKHDVVSTNINNISGHIEEIKELMKVMNQRVYELNQRSKNGQ